MNASIVSCTPAGPGRHRVIVEKPNYGRDLELISVTRWVYVVRCTPVINAYFGDDPEDADEAERLIIEEATSCGTKQIIKH